MQCPTDLMTMNRSCIEVNNQQDLGLSLNQIVGQNPESPKLIKLVSDSYVMRQASVLLPSGWKVEGYGNGQGPAITTIKTNLNEPAFKLGELGLASSRKASLSSFKVISENNQPAFRLKNSIESIVNDLTILSGKHPSLNDTGRGLELLGGRRHGVYKANISRVEVIGFYENFYIEGDLTGDGIRRCNGNAFWGCRSDGGYHSISISGTDHIDFHSHTSESNTGAGLFHRKPKNKAFSLRTNLHGGRFENKRVGGVDFDVVNSSTGGASFTKLYGTRWGNKNDPNSRLIVV